MLNLAAAVLLAISAEAVPAMLPQPVLSPSQRLFIINRISRDDDESRRRRGIDRKRARPQAPPPREKPPPAPATPPGPR